jgi:hypothetical protein
VAVLNADNVRFVPGDQVFNEELFRSQVISASAKMSIFGKALAPYHTDVSLAINLLVLDAESWFEKGF